MTDSTPQVTVFIASIASVSQPSLSQESAIRPLAFLFPPIGCLPLACLFAGSLLIVLFLDVIVQMSFEVEARNGLLCIKSNSNNTTQCVPCLPVPCKAHAELSQSILTAQSQGRGSH
jgi:hypothetical protein